MHDGADIQAGKYATGLFATVKTLSGYSMGGAKLFTRHWLHG